MPEQLFTDANHVCVVTHDLDRAVRVWWEKYGVGPWRVYAYHRSNMSATVDGRPTDFAMRAALCQLGPHFRMEIIQPLDDRSPYARSLEKHGGADHVHHVRLDVGNFDAAVDHLRGLGLAAVFEGDFKGGAEESGAVSGKYFATEDDLGFILEIANVPEGFWMPDPEYVYPRE
jgi:methylmalonyl-CoA/ethylmalonyl-CoA epimerase